MSKGAQLIYEVEITYPHEGSKDGKGIETYYFYDDGEHENESFKRFELKKVLEKKHGTLTYMGSARLDTVARFKRDPLKMQCVSRYADPDHLSLIFSSYWAFLLYFTTMTR